MNDPITQLLRNSRTIAVIGLSDNPMRPSYGVSEYMQKHGYRIIPVNPKHPDILGEKCYAALQEIPHKIDMVDCFRKTADIVSIAQQAIAVGARVLWQQLGVANQEADALVRAAGLDSVMGRCVKIEHARLFGGLGWAGVNTKVISAKRPKQIAN